MYFYDKMFLRQNVTILIGSYEKYNEIHETKTQEKHWRKYLSQQERTKTQENIKHNQRPDGK